MAKEFLSQNNIPFEAKDINVDAEARNELIRRNIGGVPTFLIGDEVVVGLDTARIMALVNEE